MEDIVAVKVVDSDGVVAFYLTWGRIQDRIDPAPLEALVLRHARQSGVRADRAHLCATLQEAAGEPYFFEGLFSFSQRPIPFGEGYQEWRRSMDEAMREGKELFLLGQSERM